MNYNLAAAKLVSVLGVVFLICLFLGLWLTKPTTPEEIAHKQWEQVQKQNQLEADRAFKLEQMKIQAEIEKAKPVEVKVQEVKNQETTTGEAIQNVAGAAAATYVGLKVLDLMMQ